MREKHTVRPSRVFRPILVAIGLGIGLIFLSSCATVAPVPEAEVAPRPPPASPTPETEDAGARAEVPEAVAADHLVFRSSEYVVVKLQDKESAAELAGRFLGDHDKSWVVEDANGGQLFEAGQVVVIPLATENRGGLSGDGYQTVPVLCYHQFAEGCKSSLCISPGDFERQLAYLRNEGYQTISLADLLEFMKYRKAIPRKSIVISIDDGYRSFYDIAYPILKKYDFTATLFIYTDFIEATRIALTWDELRMLKSDGFEIESHTLSHSNLTKKRDEENDGAYLDRVRREISVSKQILDRELNQNTLALAFPYGAYNQEIMDLTESLGYKMALSVTKGGNPFFADPFRLRRSQVLKPEVEYFVSRLQTFRQLDLR